MSKNRVTLKRMFRDPFMPHLHTYHLVHADGRQEHLCNLTHEYVPYYGKRMWYLDPIVGPSAKYPTKAEAIADAVEYLKRNEHVPGSRLANEYVNERHATFV